MTTHRTLPGCAAILGGILALAIASPARAACGCPAGSQWIAVGQATKADTCGLQILLRKIEGGALHAQDYIVYVKSNLMPATAKPDEQVIQQNNSISLPLACGTLLIGAHRAPQKDFVELNWSYF